jgi:hypothetical protein
METDRVEELMTLLDCTEEQAKSVIEYDQKVDKMSVKECESDLTDEQKAVAKKYRQGDRKPTVYNFDTRKRKTDDTKKGLIELLAETIKEQDCCNALDITNAERQIDFEWGGRKLRIVLSAPRK